MTEDRAQREGDEVERKEVDRLFFNSQKTSRGYLKVKKKKGWKSKARI